MLMKRAGCMSENMQSDCIQVVFMWLIKIICSMEYSGGEIFVGYPRSALRCAAWSEDGMYLANRSSGRTWTDCGLLDCHSWKELPAPDIQSLCELAEDFPPASGCR